MNNNSLMKDVTIVLPCWNEAAVIGLTVKHYHKLGFNNILVLNDASRDSTAKNAKNAGAKVINNFSNNGFTLTVLRGLYTVNTKNALIIDPDRRPIKEQLMEYLDFATQGNYSLLFARTPRNLRQYSKITKYLKKRFGIFLDEPDFDVTFLGKPVMDALKTEVSLSDSFLYFSLIAHAIKLKLKVGTYVMGATRMRASKISKLLGMQYYRLGSRSPNKYFSYAVPDLSKSEYNDKKNIAIITALITFVVTTFADLLRVWLTR